MGLFTTEQREAVVKFRQLQLMSRNTDALLSVRVHVILRAAVDFSYLSRAEFLSNKALYLVMNMYCEECGQQNLKARRL